MPQGHLQQWECWDLHYQLPADGGADDNPQTSSLTTAAWLDSVLIPIPPVVDQMGTGMEKISSFCCVGAFIRAQVFTDPNPRHIKIGLSGQNCIISLLWVLCTRIYTLGYFSSCSCSMRETFHFYLWFLFHDRNLSFLPLDESVFTTSLGTCLVIKLISKRWSLRSPVL